LHAAVFGMNDALDLLVAAGAEPHSLEEAAVAGSVEGWLTPEEPLQAPSVRSCSPPTISGCG